MIVIQCFVEFIFYSFLGWVWESIYCTVKEKKWADRGFLFGPICPIYGCSVVGASVVFSQIPVLSDPKFPLLGIFIICCLGSAVAEFFTSWVLEKRFHARWWDYSDMPLNIQGRICVPVSIGFGIAGVIIVKYLIPVVNQTRLLIPGVLYGIVALICAAVFGADFALTEVSLSQLLSEVEKMHSTFNERAQENYERIASVPKEFENKVKSGVESIESIVSKERQSFEEILEKGKTESSIVSYIQNANFVQKIELSSIQKLMPIKGREDEHNKNREKIFEGLKKALDDKNK